MAVSYKSSVNFGVLLDPNGDMHVNTTPPSGPDLTFLCWFYMEGTGFEGFGGSQGMFHMSPSGASNDIIVKVSPSNHHFILNDFTNGDTDTGVLVSQNTLYFVALVINGTAVRLYVNGTLIQSVTVGSTTGTVSLIEFGSIGSGFSANKFDGGMSGGLIYSRALNVTEINTQMNTSFAAVSVTNLFGQYRFLNAATGATDGSGNANDLSVTGLADDANEPTFSAGSSQPFVRRTVWSDVIEMPNRIRGPPGVAAIAAPAVPQVDQPPGARRPLVSDAVIESPPPLRHPNATTPPATAPIAQPPVRLFHIEITDWTGPTGLQRPPVTTLPPTAPLVQPPVRIRPVESAEWTGPTGPGRPPISALVTVNPQPPAPLRLGSQWPGPDDTAHVRPPVAALLATAATVDAPPVARLRTSFDLPPQADQTNRRAWLAPIPGASVDRPVGIRRASAEWPTDVAGSVSRPGIASITAPGFVGPPRPTPVAVDAPWPVALLRRMVAAVIAIPPVVDAPPVRGPARQPEWLKECDTWIPLSRQAGISALASIVEPSISRRAIIFSGERRIRPAKLQWDRTHDD